MCGGFELLTMKDKSHSKLNVVSYGSCRKDEIRCFGTGRNYVRSIQADYPVDDSLDFRDQYEDCLICKVPITLSDLREHMKTCGSEVCD